MLFVVLILVLAALGLLLTAVLTSTTLYAWCSLGVSALATLVLVVDWIRRRRREKVGKQQEAGTGTVANEGVTESRDAAGTAPAGAEEDPPEEETDAADQELISELDSEVRVLDEHPRYHRDRCHWLAGRPTLVLALPEARELGFTPCGVCTPDATLAAEHRAQRAGHG